jgi:hypothetical protein
MNARDFTAEQDYFLSRHRLHQQSLHGTGIVCGLEVRPHPNRECASKGWVVITPGIAIDCYGREILVREPVVVQLDRLFPADVKCGDEARHSQEPDKEPQLPKEPPVHEKWFLLGLRYGELCVEPVPVLADTTGCDPRTAANRVREIVCVRYKKLGQEPHPCWGRPRRECAECPPPVPPSVKHIPESLEAMLKSLCGACDDFIPLARCRYWHEAGTTNANIPQAAITQPQDYIDHSGRRYLPSPLGPQQLTHICKASWKHNGETRLQELETAYANAHGGKHGVRFTLTFDRPLDKQTMPELVQHAGTNFFQVLAVRHDKDWQPPALWGRKAEVTLDDTLLHLHYDIAHCDLLCHHPRGIQIILNCDFLTDECGRAVDGDHINGSLGRDPKHDPLAGSTGDGVEGGTFQSWFKLKCE